MKNFIIPFVILIVFFLSCKKSSDTDNSYTGNSQIDKVSIEKQYTDLTSVKKAIMANILNSVQANSVFKTIVENECLKQKTGDYTVALDRLIELNAQNSFIPIGSANELISLVKQMKKFRPNEIPNLYVPVMEKRDLKEKSNKGQETGSQGNARITMVDQDNEIGKMVSANNNVSGSEVSRVPEVNACAPGYYFGYIIDDGGSLTYSNCIDEQLAYTTDVWVLGYEETVSPGNMIASSFDGYTGGYTGGGLVASRIQGRTEYGGRIQVTNLGNIEPWVRGKPEFKHFVYNSAGTLIHEHAFGKLRRSHFNGSDWISLHCTIGNWNTSVWGDITYERWIEENRGTSITLTQTITTTNNGVTSTYVINTPLKSEDSNLGLANIQFTDPTAWQPPLALGNYSSFKYTYTNMNMQREDYQ